MLGGRILYNWTECSDWVGSSVERTSHSETEVSLANRTWKQQTHKGGAETVLRIETLVSFSNSLLPSSTFKVPINPVEFPPSIECMGTKTECENPNEVTGLTTR